NLGSANVLLVVFGVFWVANDIPPFILTASRILFAMSFDRVLPAPLANVNDRFHSPINAVIIVGIVALGGVSRSLRYLTPGVRSTLGRMPRLQPYSAAAVEYK